MFDTEKILEMKDGQEKVYIFGVDLEYPKELHYLHLDYPLAPENVFDNKELPKLTTTLYDKKKYILHYTNRTTIFTEDLTAVHMKKNYGQIKTTNLSRNVYFRSI